ncbi:FRAS1- extracellular matrix protein 1 [Chamberlinius hualienensis]
MGFLLWLLVAIFCPFLVTCNYNLSVIPIVRHLDVAVGRRIHLNPLDLGFNFPVNNNEGCSVEVILGEAIAQRVGRFQPETFDCTFSNGSVYYSHFGSRLLQVDIVRLRVVRGADPVVQPIEFHFHIQLDVPYKKIEVLNHLSTFGFFGVSQPIDERILNFKTDSCRVIVRVATYDSKWPKYGQLIYGKERVALDAPLVESCAIFPHLKLRYEHLSPPTPDVDYIDLLIESADNTCKTCVYREWIQLTVNINGGRPNLPPKLGTQSSFQLNAELFRPVIVTSKVLSAEDNETAATNLIFNVTQRLFYGYFHLVSNPTIHLSSFLQRDVIGQRVAYTAIEAKDQDVHIDIIDELFSQQSITLKIKASNSIRHEVDVISGLIVFEGQSVAISSKNFKLKRKTTQPRISFQILAQPRNGNLTVDGRNNVKYFYWLDIEWGLLKYTHDGSNTVADEILLSTGNHKLRLPITVVVTDDSPPALNINEGITVDEGRTVVIGPELLKAVDPDTANDERINYHVIRAPQAGYLLKLMKFDTGFIRVTNFTQSEIEDGQIVYTHAIAKLFLDEFQLVLNDGHSPVPNYSPVYDVSVVVRPLADDPPRPLITATFSAIVKEDEVLYLDRSIVGFINKEAREDDIFYNITSHLKPSDGKFVLTSSYSSKEELALLPSISLFSQLQVNERAVIYVPPWSQDIGPHIMRLNVKFSVFSGDRNAVANHQIRITVLPVDDKQPIIEVQNVTVGQRQTFKINETVVFVTDKDTEDDDLILSLETKPKFGTVTLDQESLLVGQRFSYKAIRDSRITYIHRGRNLRSDLIVLSATDGINKAALATIEVSFYAIDVSEQIVEHREISDQMVVSVMEKDQITIPMELLMLEQDHNSTNVHYAILKSPHHGSVYVRGRRTNSFTQSELTNGDVQYIHDGTEIGHHPQLDDVWLTVTNDFSRGRSGPDTVQSLKFNIIPVDNVSPRLSAGKSIQVSEGGEVTLSEDNLVLIDDDSASEQLLLVIAKSPLYGVILLDQKLTRHFRYNQLTEGRVSYAQTNHRWLEYAWDSVMVYATDGVHRSELVKIDINITLVNDEAPQITVKNITVVQRGSKVLDRSVLSVTDLDWPQDKINISLLIPPLYGRLIIGHGATRLATYFSNLSWTEWDKSVVSYVHFGSSVNVDQFTLSVSDGRYQASATIVVNVTSAQVPVKPPAEIFKLEITSPETLENFGDGLYGFVFTRHHIKLQSTSSIAFKVVSKPSSGRLDNVFTNQKDISTFDIKDIHNEFIRYVILQANGGKDSFILSAANTNATYRVDLVWSIIYFQKSILKVCESDGLISINVLRSSNLNRPAFVNIQAVAGTAKEMTDYRPSRIRHLQFSDGVSSLSWDLSIVNDENDEKDEIERFTVILSDPVNALILPQSSTLTIEIFDRRQGSCLIEDRSKMKTPLTDTISNPQDCNHRNAGQKLVINYGVTKIVLACDGTSWNPT